MAHVPSGPIRWVRINEVHKVAPWSRSTTYKLAQDGKLKVRRLGRMTVVDYTDIAKLLEGDEDGER